MGNRANVCVKTRGDKVYLYTHWRGTELPEIVRRSLSSQRGRNRWDDSQYLARIIFSDMIRDDIDAETGFGISSKLGDGGDRIVTVDVGEKVVFVNEADYTFSEFCDLKEARWPFYPEKYPDDREWAGEQVKNQEP